MKIDKSTFDDYAVLTLKGEFDTFYCPSLQQEVEALVERGVNHLILDLRMVKFINSTALGAIIKAHKRCRAEAGELVVAQPSSFVRDVIKKVGIDKLITICDTEQEAQKSIIKHLNQRELAGSAPVDHEKVLISFPDETRNKMLGQKRATLIGTMANVDGSKAQFLWNGQKSGLSLDQAKTLFFKDGEVHLKFQVKMIKKSFFELRGKVTQTDAAEDGGVRVTVHFAGIETNDRDALSQFAEDMAFLKRQLPG
ncbi:MAG: STAS domain-containing protein [Planctomycetota bacterium]